MLRAASASGFSFIGCRADLGMWPTKVRDVLFVFLPVIWQVGHRHDDWPHLHRDPPTSAPGLTKPNFFAGDRPTSLPAGPEAHSGRGFRLRLDGSTHVCAEIGHSRLRRDLPTSAPGLGHVCAGTRSLTPAPGLGRSRLRRDSATSAPGTRPVAPLNGHSPSLCFALCTAWGQRANNPTSERRAACTTHQTTCNGRTAMGDGRCAICVI